MSDINIGISGDLGHKSVGVGEEIELGDRAKDAEKKRDPEWQVELVVETRLKWSHSWDFTLSALGYVVGFGNVLRFPYLAYRNGGCSFLIPYTIMLFLIGLPLFFLEVAIGQYSHNGPTKVFKRLAPAMKGIGFTMLFMSFITTVYYNVLIAWAIRYLISGMASNLPWFSSGYHVYGLEIGNETIWNTCCLEIEIHNGSASKYAACSKANDESQHESYHDIHWDWEWDWDWDNVSKNESVNSDLDDHCIFSTVEYFNNTIGLGDGSINETKFEGMKWENVGCLLASWVIVCACCILGFRSMGKVVYFTVPFPYAVLVIMFIWSLTLEGAAEGIIYYVTPDVTKLLDPYTWSVAATQVFYSLSVGVGGLTSLASHNNFDTNCHRASVIICITNCLTSVFAGFVLFATLGNMAHSTGLGHEVQHMLAGYEDGPELAFITYPMALRFSPVPQLWSFLFFLMLITLGLDTSFVFIDTISTAMEENFDCTRRNNRDDIH